MQELLIAVARGLVEDKDAVQVTVDPAREDGTVVYHLTVAEGDMGRVMGVVKTRLAGKADMGQVSGAVKAALAG